MATVDANGSGIYAIIHEASGRIYIGSAVNIRDRWRGHRGSLNRGTHHSRHLQNAWSKYGGDAFSFSILERCDRAILILREQVYLDEVGPAFNVCPTAGSSLGRHPSPECRAKIAAALVGRPGRPWSQEQKEKLRQTKLGKRRPPETIKRMQIACIGRRPPPITEEGRKKISAARMGNCHWLGRKHTPESIERMKAAQRRRRGKEGDV